MVVLVGDAMNTSWARQSSAGLAAIKNRGLGNDFCSFAFPSVNQAAVIAPRAPALNSTDETRLGQHRQTITLFVESGGRCTGFLNRS